MNQHVLQTKNGKGISLKSMEEIDNQKSIPWDELVRRNREKLMRSGVLNM